MKNLVVAFVPDPMAGQVESLIHQTDRWSQRHLPPHLTIIRPFEAELSADVARRILELPVSITIAPQAWGRFDNPSNHVLYIDPGQAEPEQARQQLLSVVPELQPWSEPLGSGNKPHYHITVARHIPDEDAHALTIPELDVRTLGTAEVTRLTLLVQGKDDSYWRPY